MRHLLCNLLFAALMAIIACGAKAESGIAGNPEETVCPVIRIEAQPLADLNIARGGHRLLVAGGEVVAIGGHTAGFIPTATAEYYADGEWHLMDMVYEHDDCFATPLSSGKVLIGGGMEKPLGIGHTYSVEMYDPATHAFMGFGCLDRKRCFAQGVELDSGRVVVTGNWYDSPDNVEMFDGVKYFRQAREVSQNRAQPYVFRTSGNDVIIFSGIDEHADFLDTIIVDRLYGDPFRVTLFDEWRPLHHLMDMNCGDAMVDGISQRCVHSYLFPVANRDGQVAIALAEDTLFSLLPTDCLVPMECNGSRISWYDAVVADRQAQLAYLTGYGIVNHELYVLAIDLTTTPAALTLYHTSPQRYVAYANPVLTADGDLLLVGGVDLNHDGSVDNFTPHASTLLLPVGNAGRQMAGSSNAAYLWVAALLLVVLLAAALYYKLRHARQPQPRQSQDVLETSSDSLMERINQLMDEQKPYLNSDLKLQDMADMLGSNRTYISDSIKSATNQTFTQFVNTYRVNHAKELLRNSPDMKISAIASESGFGNEASFFRTFKAITGTTPSDWRVQKG